MLIAIGGIVFFTNQYTSQTNPDGIKNKIDAFNISINEKREELVNLNNKLNNIISLIKNYDLVENKKSSIKNIEKLLTSNKEPILSLIKEVNENLNKNSDFSSKQIDLNNILPDELKEEEKEKFFSTIISIINNYKSNLNSKIVNLNSRIDSEEKLREKEIESLDKFNSYTITEQFFILFPKFASLIFIESIAIFFLRQYKNTMDDFRYYEQVKSQHEYKFLFYKLIQHPQFNSKENQNYFLTFLSDVNLLDKLKNDETTLNLEQKKLNNLEGQNNSPLANFFKPISEGMIGNLDKK